MDTTTLRRSYARDRAGTGIEILARLGYAAKGAVYIAVGVLTATAAFSAGSSNAQGSRDAMAQVAQEPWGTALLVLMVVGLAGYVIWRLVQAIKDPEQRGTSLKGLAIRGVLLLSAAVYGSLGVWIVTSLLNGGGSASSSGGGSETWSARLLQQPYGVWLLGALGVGIIAYGLAEWVKAYRGSFEKRLRPDLNGEARDTVRKVARVGLASRGLVFLIMGGFIVAAAVNSDPSQARGLEGSLEAVGQQAYGPWLMGVVAVGLAAYGILQVVKAWYRRIGPVRA